MAYINKYLYLYFCSGVKKIKLNLWLLANIQNINTQWGKDWIEVLFASPRRFTIALVYHRLHIKTVSFGLIHEYISKDIEKIVIDTVIKGQKITKSYFSIFMSTFLRFNRKTKMII